jgi:hypothetical protein
MFSILPHELAFQTADLLRQAQKRNGRIGGRKGVRSGGLTAKGFIMNDAGGKISLLHDQSRKDIKGSNVPRNTRRLLFLIPFLFFHRRIISRGVILGSLLLPGLRNSSVPDGADRIRFTI